MRVFVTRNSATPVFQHGDLTYTLSEDQALGVSFGGVDATDSDSVSFRQPIVLFVCVKLLIKNS